MNTYVHMHMFLSVNCTGSLKMGMPISQIVLIYDILNKIHFLTISSNSEF